MFVLSASSHNAGAKFRKVASKTSPWAPQRSMSVQRGTQGCCRGDGHVCVCHLPVRMSWRLTLLPPAPSLYPVFPAKEIWARGAEKHRGVPEPWRGWGSRGRTHYHTPAPKAGATRGLPLPLQSRSPQPRDTHHQMASPQESCGQGSLGTLVRAAGHGRWHRQKTQRVHCPSQVDFPPCQYLAFQPANFLPTLHGHKSDKCWCSEVTSSLYGNKNLQKITLL